jgi:hypothetical protein
VQPYCGNKERLTSQGSLQPSAPPRSGITGSYQPVSRSEPSVPTEFVPIRRAGVYGHVPSVPTDREEDPQERINRIIAANATQQMNSVQPTREATLAPMTDLDRKDMQRERNRVKHPTRTQADQEREVSTYQCELDY